MRAMALKRYGPLEDMEKIELSLPEPKKGEVRVRVHASALNPADYKVGLGQVKFMRSRHFPMVLGNEISGVIEAVGENSNCKVGGELLRKRSSREPMRSPPSPQEYLTFRLPLRQLQA